LLTKPESSLTVVEQDILSRICEFDLPSAENPTLMVATKMVKLTVADLNKLYLCKPDNQNKYYLRDTKRRIPLD
jgi:hypothetical protein